MYFRGRSLRFHSYLKLTFNLTTITASVCIKRYCTCNNQNIIVFAQEYQFHSYVMVNGAVAL